MYQSHKAADLSEILESIATEKDKASASCLIEISIYKSHMNILNHNTFVQKSQEK